VTLPRALDDFQPLMAKWPPDVAAWFLNLAKILATSDCLNILAEPPERRTGLAGNLYMISYLAEWLGETLAGDPTMASELLDSEVAGFLSALSRLKERAGTAAEDFRGMFAHVPGQSKKARYDAGPLAYRAVLAANIETLRANGLEMTLREQDILVSSLTETYLNRPVDPASEEARRRRRS
jgi:hypothetical protein